MKSRPIHTTTLLAAAMLCASQAVATPAGLTLNSATPTEGNTLFVARTAANNPQDPPTFQLKADLFFDNLSSNSVEVTEVVFRYPGSGISEEENTPKVFIDTDADNTNDTAVNWTLAQGIGMRLGIHHGLDSDLPTPLPATVEIDIEFDNDGDPLTLSFDLAFYDNTVPLGAYFFPARADDLDPGEYWFWSTRHAVDSGGGVGGQINPTAGSQRYALDMDVVAWDGSNWNATFDGTRDQNSDFRVWGLPLYAMGDGTIIACYRNEPDRPPGPFTNVPFVFGNSLRIQYGNDQVTIAHMQQLSIPQALCPTPSSPGNGLFPSPNFQTGLSIPVTTGQLLGLIGNTGRTTNPHIHFQVVGVSPSGPNTLSGAPMQFLNLRALADDDNVNNLGDNPTLRPLHGMTLHQNTLVMPNPCGINLPPAGLLAVSRHGVPAECYQDIFNMIVARGYAPKYVDGYEAGGDTYFNASFHPREVPWLAQHGLTGSEYQDLFDEATGNGFRLHQVDSYLENGSPRIAAIFEQRPGHPNSAFHFLNDADYDTRVDSMAAAGFVPVNVSTVEVAGNRLWTGLFVQVGVSGWTVESVADTDYQDAFDANVDAGRLPIYVHGFSYGGSPYLTGIWVDPIGGSWAAVHGRDGDEYQDDWDTHTGLGRFSRYNSGYDSGAGQPLFAAIWRGRPNTEITGTPDTPTNQTNAAFQFGSSTPFGTFECRLDGAAYNHCGGTVNLAGLAEGQHTVMVRALDRYRVRDSSPSSFTWLVDVTPPDISNILPLPDTKTVHGVLKDDPVEITTVIGWADVVADVTDDLSGVATVEFLVDGLPVPGGDVTMLGNTWSFEFEPESKNKHIYTITIVATDNAGNVAMASFDVHGVKTGKKN